jgi:hypothetical protein
MDSGWAVDYPRMLIHNSFHLGHRMNVDVILELTSICRRKYHACSPLGMVKVLIQTSLDPNG